MFIFCFVNTNLSQSFAEKQVQNIAFRTRVLVPGELHQMELQPKVCCLNIQHPREMTNDCLLTCFSKLHDSVKISNKDESRKEEAIFLCLVSG